MVREGSRAAALRPPWLGHPATVVLGGTALEHHRAGAMRAQWPDLDIAEDFSRPLPDHHAAADFRMAVPSPFLLAGCRAERLAGSPGVTSAGSTRRRRCGGLRPPTKAGGVIEEDARPMRAFGLMSVWNTDDERLCR